MVATKRERERESACAVGIEIGCWKMCVGGNMEEEKNMLLNTHQQCLVELWFGD